MAYILSLETSTSVCSVALHNKGICLWSKEVDQEKAHSTLLGTFIQSAFDQSGIDKSQLEAVAISSGPGSYTGLRIGTSLAKGLCFGLGINLISVDTLEAMARQVDSKTYKFLCPMIDARRMEVYCMVLGEKYQVIQNIESKIIDENSFEFELAQGKVAFFGNGASKCKELLGNHANAIFVEQIGASARTIGYMAFEKFKNQQFEDLSSFEPFYLKQFQAGKPKSLI